MRFIRFIYFQKSLTISHAIYLFPEVERPTFKVLYLDTTSFGISLDKYKPAVKTFYANYRPLGTYGVEICSSSKFTSLFGTNGHLTCLSDIIIL